MRWPGDALRVQPRSSGIIRLPLPGVPRLIGGPTSSGFLSQPRENEIRVIERDGRRWLQQWRMPPDGHYHQRAWIDIAELAPLTSTIRQMKRRG
jgi:hypothetical protein